MSDNIRKLSRTCLALCLVMCAVANAEVRGKGYTAPVAIAAGADGSVVYVAESVGKKIAVLNVSDGRVLSRISLRREPSGLAILPASSLLYATCSGADGKLFAIDLKRGRVKDTIDVGHTPMAPVFSQDGKTIYVCNRFGNSVSVVDIEAKKEIARIPVLREPVAGVLSQDGRYLFVANHLSAGRADGNYTAAAVSVIDTAARKVISSITLPDGSHSLRGICISPDGRHVYVTHILSRYHVPTTQLERGWINTNAMTIIDALGRKRINTVLLDDVDVGAANPWGIACTTDGKYVCVTLAGTHEIAAIDVAKLHAKLAGADADSVPNDLSFLVGQKRRLKLNGNGPRDLVIVGTTAFVAEYFSDSVGVLDVAAVGRVRASSWRLAEGSRMSVIRKGERLFNDATICFQHWQSCASCHPDGRADALNWDILNDGMGNPKQTKNMLLAHRTPPTTVTGIRDGAETSVRAGIRHIHFAVRPDEDAVAIDEYLKSLEPVPSPYLVKGRLSAEAKRGKKVFAKAMCASCHSGELFTDMQLHDLGTAEGPDEGRSFDTPTLIEIWRTAPYLYDGRAATMKEVLTTHNKDDRHGETSGLTEKELEDLEAYILSQ